MKVLKPVLLVVLFLGAIGTAFFYGLNKVRDGLVANYPTIKYVVNGALTDIDSSITFVVTKAEAPALLEAVKSYTISDSLELTVPYYGRYGVDLSVRNYRVFRDGQTIEVWLPASTLIYSELKFDKIQMNGKGYAGDNFFTVKNELYKYLLPVLQKHKSHQAKARKNVAKALMFYFIPYKFDLKFFIENQLQTLPVLPGVNKDVDEYIKEQLAH
ncbi:MAG: hypothetical protein IPN22_09135 [Bacteroidetes bacterium]|nr:hypothetical protein [Bacteroidota bacterium]